jgi:serine/threonine-protein kinase HipA
MNGERAGEWRRSPEGKQEFLYAESWLASPSARPISLSFPLRPSQEPYRDGVEIYFDNLLPDNREIRERIQRRFQTASISPFELLWEIGRDCAGALQLLPEGEVPQNVRQISAEPLSPRGVAEALSDSLGEGFGRQETADTFRISLAGAQEKIALLFRDGRWHRPTHATPTTHILKLPLGKGFQGIDLSTSVENEWLCSRIVRAYGLDVANCRIETFGEFKTLVVERFDRRLSSDAKWYIRLPQEDFCQATGTPSGLKYESDGGPGIQKIMDLLLGSEQTAQDRRDFMLTQLVFWLLAAIDGHAKNFSVFLLAGGAYRLTPRYDILSAHPMLGHGRGKLSPQKIKMAMAGLGKNRHYRWNEIQGRHWLETAKRCGFAEMQSIMDDVIARTPDVIQKVESIVPKNFPPQIVDSVLKGIKQSAALLKSNLLRKGNA